MPDQGTESDLDDAFEASAYAIVRNGQCIVDSEDEMEAVAGMPGPAIVKAPQQVCQS